MKSISIRKAHQMIEVFDKANQLVNNELLTTTKV